MPIVTQNFTRLFYPSLRDVYLLSRKPTEYILVGPVTCVRTTDKAVLVKFEGREIWVPRSCLHASENEIQEVGDTGMLIVTDYIAKLKGWI